MNTISALILTLSILFGGQPSQPTEQPSQPSVTVCHEEDACWDADTMGNHEANTLEADAWDTLDRVGVKLSEDSAPMSLSYIDTVTGEPASLPIGQFALESYTTPNAFHVYQWDTLYNA